MSRRKTFWNRAQQPHRVVALLASLAITFILHFFVIDWRLQLTGFVLLLFGINLFVYYFTDDFQEDGIFTIPSYNIVLWLILEGLLCFAIYYAQSTSPWIESYNEKLPFLITRIYIITSLLLGEK